MGKAVFTYQDTFNKNTDDMDDDQKKDGAACKKKHMQACKATLNVRQSMCGCTFVC